MKRHAPFSCAQLNNFSKQAVSSALLVLERQEAKSLIITTVNVSSS